ncbi:MAG TPA: AAA family ATPase [Solirubrobacteraceae bacterium]|nr:AAA family ATPase [Solirubrobacteraceae bacterium]
MTSGPTSSGPAGSSRPEHGTRTGRTGLLLRVSGLPGSGKTTLLEAAHARAEIAPISRDLIRAELFPVSRPHTARETELAFDVMLTTARSRLRAGDRVSLDGCCFARPRQRDRARKLADEAGARLIGVHLEIPASEAARRVGAPSDHPANDRDADLVARVAGYLAPAEPDDLVIDATLPPDEIWALLSQRLSRPD